MLNLSPDFWVLTAWPAFGSASGRVKIYLRETDEKGECLGNGGWLITKTNEHSFTLFFFFFLTKRRTEQSKRRVDR